VQSLCSHISALTKRAKLTKAGRLILLCAPPPKTTSTIMHCGGAAWLCDTK